MRKRIPLGTTPAFDPAALQGEPDLLYRRLRDKGRAVLGVGVVAQGPTPVMGADGVATDWTFGYLRYDAMGRMHGLSSRHASDDGIPVSCWTVPRWVVEWQDGGTTLHVLPGDEETGLAFAERLFKTRPTVPGQRALKWHCRTSRDHYLDEARRLLAHIHRGDIYEVNYCVERTAFEPSFDPFAAFVLLQQGTDAPFSAFHRMGDRFALCMSPERFLHLDGAHVVAEPMKGTRPRGLNAREDERLRAELAGDVKERSENVMAVDVTRNDLARTAARGSVQVTELCGVRSYPRVHQMVSTVIAERDRSRSQWEVVQAAFPMASMTGAPKVRAMQLIDQAEGGARGLYSGTLGFFAPDGTADLNVVIRTILFDRGSGVLSLSSGSALTALCDPGHEWEECALKARSILNVLGHAG